MFHSPMSSSGTLTCLMYFILLSFHVYQPLSSYFICITAYVSTQCLGISLHQFPFGWLAFTGTSNLLTHFTHHLSQLYIFVFVNNHIILHHHHVRWLLFFILLRSVTAPLNKAVVPPVNKFAQECSWTYSVWWYDWSIIKHAAGWPGYRESGGLILAAEFTPHSIISIAAFGIFSPANGKRNEANWPSNASTHVKYFS